MKIRFSQTTIVGIALLLLHGLAANAAEVKVISGLAMRTVWEELGPEFEHASNHKLAIWYGVRGSIRKRIDAGGAFDLAVFGKAGLDAYIKQGTIAADTSTEIARVGLGVGKRAGAPKPDIGSVEAFKRALLDAKSVSYIPQAANGLHMAKVYERLGITEQMKSKNVWPQLKAKGVDSFQAVRDGDAELIFVFTHQLRSVDGVEFVGPFPPELQKFNVYVAGVATAAKQPEAAKALIRFLRSPAAIAVIKTIGMEPASANTTMSSQAGTAVSR